MRIKELELRNFKRFGHLTIKDIPDTARLVLLIGSNGSGKSSVFDAFGLIKTRLQNLDKTNSVDFWNYFHKASASDGISMRVQFDEGEYLLEGGNSDMSSNSTGLHAGSFYGRTSFRQVSRLTRTMLGQGGTINPEADADRPIFLIDKDLRFENDIERITGIILKDFFRSGNSNEQIKERYIHPINVALHNIFGQENGTKLELLEIIPPLEGKVAQITFRKGVSEFHYDLLSAGEKEVFNILINLLSRSAYFANTIYYFDEVDLHLNTRLQYALLKELVENWIPENSQLWTASHSLGFIEYAKESELGCVIDFDDLDFDAPQTIYPSAKDRFEVFEIAVSKDFIDKSVQGRRIVFSENTDTPFYNDLGIDNAFFFKGLDKRDVFTKAKELGHWGLIDRDYLMDEEILELQSVYPFLRVLPYYSFENLLFHPDNLREYFESKGQSLQVEQVRQYYEEARDSKKDDILMGLKQARDGYPFYKENANAARLKSFKENYKAIAALLKSTDFETFYKVFPVKEYGKNLPERQNLQKRDLVKTRWFKAQLEQVLGF